MIQPKTATTQRTLDFNPTELTDAERARLRRSIDAWTLEEEAEDFQQLPCETVAEFLAARDMYLSSVSAFGPMFPKPIKTCEAWQIMHSERTAAPQPQQLALPFDNK